MSRFFKDTEGREWTVAINIAVAKRLRDRMQIDLLDKVGMTALSNIAADPIRLADVLYVICCKQAEERKISDEDFGAALSGDALEAAATAFMEAMADFFPPSQRTVLHNALAKHKKLEQAAVKRATEILDSNLIDEEISRRISAAQSNLSQMAGSESP